MDDLQNWQNKFIPCEYSTRLLNKLNRLNNNKPNVDINAITKAIFYAKKYHGQQKRQSGEPFYSHPLEVAYMIADYLFTTDAIIISILHDTIEDTELTETQIALLFNAKIAKQVENLTRIKNGIKITSSELINQLLLEKNYETLLIKVFDRLHNMQTIGAKSPEKTQKIVKETIEAFIASSIIVEMPNLTNELTRLCFEALKLDANSSSYSYLCPFTPDSFQPLSPAFQNV